MFPDDIEQEDPLSALLARIAFIATSNSRRDGAFRTFNAKYEVSRERVVEWLGDLSCVLIVDEINRAEKLTQKCPEASSFFSFLKETFLSRAGRTLVFSSHIVCTKFLSSNFLACTSGRGVLVEQLPLIDDFSKAKKLVADLTPQELLYYSLIPALIYTRDWTQTNAGSLEQELKDNPLSKEDVRRLLLSFITGSSAEIDPRFLPFFDTKKSGDAVQVIWIMRHMDFLLEILGNHFLVRDMEMAEQLFTLRRLLGWFRETKKGSGDGFEMLFAFTFLLRVFCGLPCDPFFPFGVTSSWSFSFNKFLNPQGRDLSDCLDYSQLQEIVIPPQDVTFPHVAYYVPRAQSFKKYDAFAYFYTTAKERVAMPAFQCKEGRAMPSADADVAEFPSSFLVRGNASGTADEIRGWRFVSKAQVEHFFGLSGRMWTPSELTALRARLALKT